MISTSVLPLTDTRAGWNQQVGFVKALDRDRAYWYAVLDKFRGHRLGTSNGQTLIVLRGARCTTGCPIYNHNGRITVSDIKRQSNEILSLQSAYT
jgi:hypothetical protein